MTAMTNALKQAGMKTPTLKYRIWHWLKDHPEKTTEDVQKALGLNYSPYGELLAMETAGILKVYSDVSRKAGMKGIVYKIKRYSVVNANEYEPPARKKHKSRADKVKLVPYVNPHAKTEAEKPTQATTGLTEAEKFAAYLEFKALMKEMKK